MVLGSVLPAERSLCDEFLIMSHEYLNLGAVPYDSIYFSLSAKCLLAVLKSFTVLFLWCNDFPGSLPLYCYLVD